MPKVTSKLQVTVPKAIADQYGIRPGDTIAWVAAGDAIRVLPGVQSQGCPDLAQRLRLFDQATERQRQREAARPSPSPPVDSGRGWRREDLYERGRPG